MFSRKRVAMTGVAAVLGSLAFHADDHGHGLTNTFSKKNITQTFKHGKHYAARGLSFAKKHSKKLWGYSKKKITNYDYSGTWNYAVDGAKSGACLAYDFDYCSKQTKLKKGCVATSVKWKRSPKRYFSDDVPLDLTSIKSKTFLLNPGMLEASKGSSQRAKNIRKYIKLIRASAKKEGVDGNLLANQLWQESIGFRADVVDGRTASGKNAVGIAQFISSTGKLYGLKSYADRADPEKAIPAAAKLMAKHLKDYNGDYVLALAAYNGGPKAINVVNRLVTGRVTGEKWLSAMFKRRATCNSWRASKGRGRSRGAYYNETFKYIGIITGASWSTGALKDAKRLNTKFNLKHLTEAASNDNVRHAGVSARQQPYPFRHYGAQRFNFG